MNRSPTSTSVVAETLKRSQKVAEECSKYNISVTYDLAIAKVAMILQAEEKPTYDNVFIHLGFFHITCAFFFYAWKVHSRVGWITYSKWNPCYRKTISKVIPVRLILQEMQKISSITWSSNGSLTCPGLCRSVWWG